MVGRCCGLLLLPTIVTALFNSLGAMTLMFAVFSAVVTMLLSLLVAHGISYNYGVAGRIRGKDYQRDNLCTKD